MMDRYKDADGYVWEKASERMLRVVADSNGFPLSGGEIPEVVVALDYGPLTKLEEK